MGRESGMDRANSRANVWETYFCEVVKVFWIK